MMKTKLKFFLVFLAMIVGTNCVWADETVGNSDNSTQKSNNWYSTEYTLTSSQKLHLDFTNYTKGDANNHNWLLFLSDITTSPIVLQADNWWYCDINNTQFNPGNPSGEGFGKVNYFSSTIDWDHFLSDMDGAHVTIDINNMGYWVVINVSATNNGRTYSEILKIQGNDGDMKAKLSVDNSHLIITRAETTTRDYNRYDFSGASTLDSRFEAGQSEKWYFSNGGYFNDNSGNRSFTIKNLQNGDMVSICFEKTNDSSNGVSIGTNYDAITFSSTNAKIPSGEAVTSSTLLISEGMYYITEDGNLTLNVHRKVVIKSVDIFRTTFVTPSISFSETSFDSQPVGANFSEPRLTVTPATATAYYSSSNTSVAIVDEETGEVTLVGAGSVTITATLTVNNTTVSDSYSLTVTSATTSTTDYIFTGTVGDKDMSSAGTTTVNGATVTILDFTSQTATTNYPRTSNHPDNRFGVVNSLTDNNDKWFLRNKGLYAAFGGNRDFYVLNLYNGDRVTIEYEVWDLDTSHLCGSSTLSSTNATLTNGSWGTNTSGNVEYTITESGALKLSIGRYTYIKKVTIVHESSASFTWSDGNLANKFDTSSGGKKLTYKITDMNFSEPTAVKVPASATHTVSSLNTNVALMNSESLGDVLFVNTGTVNIQGTMKTNGQDYRDTYTVDVWADVATFTDVNNRYEVTGIGKLQEKEVTAVRGLKMNFGSDDDCTLVLYDETYSAFVAYTINKTNGWRHRNAGGQSTIPTHGSFYKFEALTSGKLKFSGVKNGNDNTVVLMDASDMNGDPVFTIEDTNKGVFGTTGDGIQLHAGHTYYLFGNVPNVGNESNSTWSAYMLTWFSYESDFKLVNIIGGVETEVSYGAAARTNDNDITSVSNVVTIKGVNNPTVSVVGKSGNITTATASTTSSGENSILNVTGISGSGGAIRIKIESSAGTAYFTLTIPYATHTWDFRTGTRTGENAENGQTRAALATEIKSHGINDDPTNYPTGAALGLSGVTRVYRSSNKTAAGVWEHITDPLLVANGNVEGDNGFYIDKTSGLIFVTGAQSFGALETTCRWNGTNYTSYDPAHIHGLTEVDDETEYYFGPEVTTEAEYVYMKTGSKIIFPGVRPGQYIKIYTRRLSSLGDHWRAENLIDLEDKPYTYSGEFQYLGINEDRSSTDGTPDAWAGNNLKGSAIFKVPVNNSTTGSTAYDANNTDISLMPSLTVTNGWVRILKIELLDEYKTDLYLSETNSNGFFKVDYDSEYASVVVYKKNGVTTSPVSKFYEGTVGKIGATHAHTCDYEVEKIPTTLNVTVEPSTSGSGPVYNDITLTFNGGNGLVKVIQREYGDDIGVNERANQHIINKKETYIAVSEVNVQTYPYTWDFTTHNMYQGNSTTATRLGNATGTDYGTWTRPTPGVNTFQVNNSATINTSMQQKNISNDSYEQVTKPLFAQGGQLSAGSTAIAEVEGLGISRPYGSDRTHYTWKTTGSNFGRVGLNYKTFDLSSPITINGSELSGAKTITIPQVPKGMYIFISASGDGPMYGQIKAGGEVIDYVNEVSLKGGVWCYYQNKGNDGEARDVVIPLNDNASVRAIAVTDILKSMNKLGYATESRNHAIDHTYQDQFTNHPVKAWAVTTYGGIPYEYNGYPEVKLSEEPIKVVPANTGIVLCDKTYRSETTGFSTPLFYPAVNVAPSTTGENNDMSILETNWMAPNVNAKEHTTETIYKNHALSDPEEDTEGSEDGSDVKCTKFIMATTYYTYSDISNTFSGSKTASAESFYRMILDKNGSTAATNNTLGANKAYLLIPTEHLPEALWNKEPSGSGVGPSRGVIYIDLEDFEMNDATNIDNVNNDAVIDWPTDHDVYYSIAGARIYGKPTRKGFYIHNGKKISVK